MTKRTTRHSTRARSAAPAIGAGMASHQGATPAGQDMAMWDWVPGSGSADADLLPDLEMLTARSRDLGRNNGLMAGAIQTSRDSIIGSVLRLSTMPDYRLLGRDRDWAREWGNVLEAKFGSWADSTECDAGRSLNLMGLTHQMLAGGLLNGDSLALPLWVPRAGDRWSTRLMLVESDRLSTPPLLATSPFMRAGIEFDRYGAPVAYHVLKTHPGDTRGLWGTTTGMKEWDRIPAFTPWGRRRVIHLHDKERTGQSRGKPLVSAVLRDFKMAGDFASNELQASLSNSLVAAFLESDLGQEGAAALFGDKARDVWNESLDEARSIRRLKGAAIIPLPVGAKMSSFTPGRPNVAFDAFMTNVECRIAAGMNMSREVLMKDFSKSNYSSARATLLEVWRYFLGRRRWITDLFLRPAYELWFEEAVHAGEIEAPDYYANRYAYTRARFIFGGRGWVDPVKEAQAAGMRMASGISTLQQECAEQGLDYEEVMDQQQIELAMRRERGLPPLASGAQSKPAINQADERGKGNGGDDKDEDAEETEGAPA